MDKKYSLFVIISLLLLIVPQINAFSLPLVEYSCYGKYALNSLNYNFIFEGQYTSAEIEQLRKENPNINYVILKEANEMCRYTKSPKSCYECIALNNFDINTTESPKDNNSRTSNEIILFAVLIIIIALVGYLIYKKRNGKR
jgi:hypothetical protein